MLQPLPTPTTVTVLTFPMAATATNNVHSLFLDVDALWSVQTSGPYDTKQRLLRAEP